MADVAPTLLMFRWPDDQTVFVHFGVDGDVFQDKLDGLNDGLNKRLGSHWESFFYDSLCDNKIIVVFPLLPRACSVFIPHTYYR